MLQSYTYMQYTVIHKIYKNESKHSEMGPVRQSRELLGLFICVCIALCTIVVHNIAQNRPDNIPSYPPYKHRLGQLPLHTVYITVLEY